MRLALAVLIAGCVFVVVTGCISARGRLTRDTLRPPDAPDRTGAVRALEQRARDLHVATSREWLLLGHWRPALLGGYTSEADGDNFFLSPHGKHDPQAELDATIAGFFSELTPYDEDNERTVQHPLCQFPARFIYLKRVLALDERALPPHDCARYREFEDSLQASTVTMVFSAYYLNNPASAFGHTFLRIGKRDRLVPEDRRQLLDFGIEFSATPDTTFAPLYAIKGIAGAFPGTFRKLPFYYKVREYNDFESRDLWEYKLALTDDEVRMLVAHVWELGSTFFDYFYLSENCSYHILDLIEASAPRLELLGQLHWPVIPVDAIKALYKNPGLVEHVDFRPSLRTRFRRDLAALPADARDEVVRVADDPAAPLALSDRERIEVLDAAQDLVDLRYAKKLVDASKGGEGVELKQRLLARRAEILEPSQDTPSEPPWSKMPQLGHGARRAALGAGFDNASGRWLALGARLALHDLADPTDGYPELSQLEFLPTSLRYTYPGNNVQLDQLDLVHVISLTSQDRFDRHTSWELRIGSERLFDRYCFGCYAGLAQFGGGVAFGTSGDRATVFVLAETRAWIGPRIDGILHSPTRAALGPALGVRLRLASTLVALVRGDLGWLPVQPVLDAAIWSVTGTLRWMIVDGFALDLSATDDDATMANVVASMMLYF